MDKQTAVHSYNGILLCNKENELSSHAKTYHWVKAVILKKAIECMIPFI